MTRLECDRTGSADLALLRPILHLNNHKMTLL